MEEILSLAIPVIFVLALALERLVPARPLPKVRRWLGKGLLFFLLTGAMNAAIPAVLAPRLGGVALVSVRDLSLPLAALITLLTSELLAYWMHRTMHRVQPLWRWTHQMHHSAERLDVAGAVLFHPFDLALQIGVTSVAGALVGASADAAAVAGFVTFLCAVFQHLNVKTPRLVGYLVQRPEGHSVHHQRGLHAYNYGNLALFDLLFGTFKNPESFVAEQGFWDGASGRTLDMLVGRDVSEPVHEGTATAAPAE